MVVITVLLVSLVAVMTTGVSQSTLDSAQPHATGSFDVNFHEAGGDGLTVSPQALAGGSTTFRIEVNDHHVYTWDGHGRVDFTCLYPGDEIEILSLRGDTSVLRTRYTLNRSLRCTRIDPIDEKFEYAYVNDEKKRVQTDYTFDIEIDPDGPGTDDTFGHAVVKQNIGTIPVTNEWHYIRRYDKALEGLGPPVWLIVMTDNVHWNDVPEGTTGVNWTDEPPGEPGINSFSVSGHDVTVYPSMPSTEPTNDIFILFEPGCDSSRMKILDVEAGYDNTLYVNDEEALPHPTSYYEPDSRTPVVLDEDDGVPGVNCPGD